MEINVAKKIDDYQIIINKGSDDGINENMRFLVFEEGDEIIDPTTNESLGVLEIPKGTFKVLNVQSKMTYLVSVLRKENKIMTFSVFSGSTEPEKELLHSIRIGDKVRITNKL
ncbi:hypothetical protein [Elizabethkingia sp. JS20170427COW]|uniref:hypothetical protein n=1 Tax=Elizabethkingia sp. JS20170427COW TaxID=2583851 RepID=UPI0011104BA6|nr:hypothetical protein [Elizabethkingia sp. JS20170427COW]QCX54409.1 hypothetical protein FGE20_11980 [Elizabethkingia sp. JS20170427COW]